MVAVGAKRNTLKSNSLVAKKISGMLFKKYLTLPQIRKRSNVVNNFELTD